MINLSIFEGIFAFALANTKTTVAGICTWEMEGKYPTYINALYRHNFGDKRTLMHLEHG